MLRRRLNQLLPAASVALSPEHRTPAWIATFVFTVGIMLLFVYQAAYSWEFTATVRGNPVTANMRWAPTDTTQPGCACSNDPRAK